MHLQTPHSAWVCVLPVSAYDLEQAKWKVMQAYALVFICELVLWLIWCTQALPVNNHGRLLGYQSYGELPVNSRSDLGKASGIPSKFMSWAGAGSGDANDRDPGAFGIPNTSHRHSVYLFVCI